MSRYHARGEAITLSDVLARKTAGKKLSMVTCYDAAFAALVDRGGVDMVLVGDSLGNVMLGFDDTTRVTLEAMIHHTAAVGRVLKRAFLAADMPFLTYTSVDKALESAGRLVQEAGAQAVKLEGGRAICPQVAAICAAGIPVIGHLGLTPQSVHALGGFKVQGRGEAAAELLLEEAKQLEQAGASALVLELIPAPLAKTVSEELNIPTIGIGAGPDCDGQVLVLQDLLGFDREFSPKFLKKYANVGETVVNALRAFDEEVKSGAFPDTEHSFAE